MVWLRHCRGFNIVAAIANLTMCNERLGKLPPRRDGWTLTGCVCRQLLAMLRLPLVRFYGPCVTRQTAPAGLVYAGLIVLGGIPTAAYSILESVGLRNELVESRLKCLRLTRKESLTLGGAVVGQD